MDDKQKTLADQWLEMGNTFTQLMRQNQAMMSSFLKQPAPQGTDPLNTGPAFTKAMSGLVADPQRLMQSNYELWSAHMDLWQELTLDVFEKQGSDAAAGDPGRDRRFKHEDWSQNPAFDYIKRSYTITSQWFVETMRSIEGLEDSDRDKVEFYSQLMVDAFSPSNFALTNPEVLRTMVETEGQSLVNGLKNLQRDMDPKTGQLSITMTDPDAFTVGKDIATTPGKVVFQNDLAQLIQYAPTTKRVFKRPLVIVPPWINKFYILDLQPRNSFIAWAVEQGYTVFVVSWVNPDTALASKTFEDYMQEGILDMLDAVEAASGERDVNMIGYCIGGTLLSATLAYMADQGDERVQSATFFASQADFSEAGALKIFTDEAQIDNLEAMMGEKGYLDGSAMSTTFNMLRANDLIWSFYVDNYLLGKEPLKFDLLHWNADATRMPRETHLFYLRQMYLHNNLAKPGGITLKGVPIDLAKVGIPIYLQSSREDHIAPYKSVFKSTGLYGGPVRFMLAGSGHIAGVINPPSSTKYGYWINPEQPKDLDAWLAGAEAFEGSWWPDWHAWLKPQSGTRVKARVPGDRDLPTIEDAPGSYVMVKS
ncbi:MAG: class I poly(R)-hydroxyalkanoic acid synthase [Pseudomonadota bacterium]